LLSGVQRVDPVADERGLERTSLHAAQADLADERAVVHEQPEAVGGVEVALALPRAAAGTERLRVGDGVGAPRLGERLPRFEPFLAPRAHLVPRVEVTAPEWA